MNAEISSELQELSDRGFNWIQGAKAETRHRTAPGERGDTQLTGHWSLLAVLAGEFLSHFSSFDYRCVPES